MTVINQPRTTTTPEQQSPSELSTRGVSPVMTSKTQPLVASITEYLSNIALTNESIDLTNNKPDDLINNKVSNLVDNKAFPTKIDDLFDIKLSTGNSNSLADSKISTGKHADVSDTKTFTNDSDDVFNDKVCINKSDKKKCTNCGNFNAKAPCAGCHKAPNIDGSPRTDVRYCSRGCQKAHWSAHRVECKNLQARKALFRAAWLMQKIFYTVRRESYNDCIVKVEEVNGELWIHEGDYDVEPTLREGGFYREFPEDIFSNEEHAEACLTLLCCTESLNHMFQVNAWLLKDICSKVTETTLVVTEPARKARYARDAWNKEWLQEILKVSLESGETYAIDLTGAQYGWHTPITCWPEYIKRTEQPGIITRHGIRGESPLGFHTRTSLAGTFSNPGDNRTDTQRGIPLVCECLKHQFNRAFFFEVMKQYNHSNFLKLPESTFNAAERDIIAKVKQMTYDAAEKNDTLLGVVLSEARVANNTMLEHPEASKNQILAYSLTVLAGLFNGQWERNVETGRLESTSFKRTQEDDAYYDEYIKGHLPEQKHWTDLTIFYP